MPSAGNEGIQRSRGHYRARRHRHTNIQQGRPVPQDSPYPHLRRLRALFNASLANPTSPYVVGEQVRQIVEGDSWQLRYPIGPDAVPFLKWRASKTDEEVVNQATESDSDYKATVEREFGLDVDL